MGVQGDLFITKELITCTHFNNVSMKKTSLHQRFIEISKPLNLLDTGTEPKLRKLDGVKVLAYDFYGTLFISGVGDIGVDDGNFDSDILMDVLNDSGVSIENKKAGKEAFKLYNIVVEEHMKHLEALGIEYPEPDIRSVWKSVLNRMREKSLISFSGNDSLYDRISVEFEARMNPVWPMPDVTETLTYFKQSGVTQGIISNSQFYTPIVLEALTNNSLSELGFSEGLLHWSFEEQMKKPGLIFYRNYIKKLTAFDASLTPENVLYIGNDMLKDVYPAREVGMKTALFAGDKRSLKWRRDDERCKNIEPDLIITELSQLKQCV